MMGSGGMRQGGGGSAVDQGAALDGLGGGEGGGGRAPVKDPSGASWLGDTSGHPQEGQLALYSINREHIVPLVVGQEELLRSAHNVTHTHTDTYMLEREIKKGVLCSLPPSSPFSLSPFMSVCIHTNIYAPTHPPHA